MADAVYLPIAGLMLITTGACLAGCPGTGADVLSVIVALGVTVAALLISLVRSLSRNRQLSALARSAVALAERNAQRRIGAADKAAEEGVRHAVESHSLADNLRNDNRGAAAATVAERTAGSDRD